MKNSGYGKLIATNSLEQKRFPCNRFISVFSREKNSKDKAYGQDFHYESAYPGNHRAK
jgi:hypothetical protein